VAYYIDTSDGVVVIRIPVIFSERTVEIVFKEEIEGIESKEAKDTGTGWLFYALIVVLVIAVAVVVVWKLLRKTSQV
jgi:diacylglycerol kinase